MSDKAREIVLKHEKRLRDPRDCHAHNSAVMLSAVQEALAYNEQTIRELEEDLASAITEINQLCGGYDDGARVAELEAALKPFADCCEHILDSEDDEEWAKFRLLIKDYRTAAKALAKASLEKHKKAMRSALADALEKAFWQFDARRKGYAEWSGSPQSERDAFKAEAAMLAGGMYLQPEFEALESIIDMEFDGLAAQEALAYNEQRIRELEEDLNLIYSEFDTEVDNPTKACTTIASLYHYSEEYRERINLLRVALASALTEINQFSGGYDDRQEVKA